MNAETQVASAAAGPESLSGSDEQTKVLSLDALRDENGQFRLIKVRAALDQAAVQEYAERMQAGEQFPPIVVYFDGAVYEVSQGGHRLAATEEVGRDEVLAEVRQGDRRAAMLDAASSNAKHGVRRTAFDKRAAVLLLLEDAEWRRWSDRAIAEKCAVSHPFVAQVRKQFEEAERRAAEYAASDGNEQASGGNVTTFYRPTDRIGRDGKSYPVAVPPAEGTPAVTREKPAEEMSDEELLQAAMRDPAVARSLADKRATRQDFLALREPARVFHEALQASYQRMMARNVFGDETRGRHQVLHDLDRQVAAFLQWVNKLAEEPQQDQPAAASMTAEERRARWPEQLQEVRRRADDFTRFCGEDAKEAIGSSMEAVLIRGDIAKMVAAAEGISETIEEFPNVFQGMEATGQPEEPQP